MVALLEQDEKRVQELDARLVLQGQGEKWVLVLDAYLAYCLGQAVY
jgi:hypothetical protein